MLPHAPHASTLLDWFHTIITTPPPKRLSCPPHSFRRVYTWKALLHLIPPLITPFLIPPGLFFSSRPQRVVYPEGRAAVFCHPRTILRPRASIVPPASSRIRAKAYLPLSPKPQTPSPKPRAVSKTSVSVSLSPLASPQSVRIEVMLCELWILRPKLETVTTL